VAISDPDHKRLVDNARCNVVGTVEEGFTLQVDASRGINPSAAAALGFEAANPREVWWEYATDPQSPEETAALLRRIRQDVYSPPEERLHIGLD